MDSEESFGWHHAGARTGADAGAIVTSLGSGIEGGGASSTLNSDGVDGGSAGGGSRSSGGGE